MTDDLSTIGKTNSSDPTKTVRGTRIVKPGEQMDKNAFLRILSGELANQDPTNAKDGTEFVAQMAQFAGLEQMANLNTNIRLVGASSLVGKVVMVKKASENGNLYFGKVTGISKDGDSITLNVTVGEEKDKDGNTVPISKKFNLEDVIELTDSKDNISNVPKEDSNNKPEGENSGENQENKDVQV